MLEINIWRDRLYGREQAAWPGAFNAGWVAYLYDASFLYDWYEGAGAYRLWDGPDDPTAKQFDELYGAATVELDEEARAGIFGPPRYGVSPNAWYEDVIADYVPRNFPELNYDEITPA